MRFWKTEGKLMGDTREETWGLHKNQLENDVCLVGAESGVLKLT